MRVTIDNHEIQYIDNDIEAINEWWKKSTSQIYKENRLIYCLRIDEVPMFSGYESFIVNNYKSINQVHIQTRSHQESIQETIQVMGEYLLVFIPVTIKIADYFYGDVSQEQWNEFSQFISGLNWIVSSLEFIKSISIPSNDTVNIILNELEPIIASLEKSVENGEHVELADLIKYELIPVIEPLQQMCMIQ